MISSTKESSSLVRSSVETVVLGASLSVGVVVLIGAVPAGVVGVLVTSSGVVGVTTVGSSITATDGVSVGGMIGVVWVFGNRVHPVNARAVRVISRREVYFIGGKLSDNLVERVYLRKEKSKKFCNSRLFAIIPARARSSAGRVPVFETDGRRFEPYRAHHFVTSVSVLDP